MLIGTFFTFLCEEVAATVCPLTFVTPGIFLAINNLKHDLEYSTQMT